MEVTDAQRKEYLRKYRVEIIEKLKLDVGLLDEMHTKGVLNQRQVTAIKGRFEVDKDGFNANTRLLEDVLLKCDLKKYNTFLYLLAQYDEDLAGLLRGEKEKTEEAPAGSKEMEKTMDRQPPKGKPDAATARAPAAAAKHEGTSITLSDAAMEVPDIVTVNREKYEELQQKAKKNENFMYKMDIWTGKPCGMALIINVQHKGQGAPLERHGTDVDRNNLQNLWGDFMHFQVTTYNDEDGLTAQEIMTKVETFSKDPQLKESQAIVVCLLAHGDAGHIQGTDEKPVSLEEICSYFSNANPNIQRRVPRLFFIQACRGGAIDKGVYRADACPTQVTVSDAFKQLPTFTDFFWGYATPHGQSAYRNRETGSWYITALVKAFYDHAHQEDLAAMHSLVNNAVSEKEIDEPDNMLHGAKTISEYKSSLTKAHLYFFP